MHTSKGFLSGTIYVTSRMRDGWPCGEAWLLRGRVASLCIGSKACKTSWLAGMLVSWEQSQAMVSAKVGAFCDASE